MKGLGARNNEKRGSWFDVSTGPWLPKRVVYRGQQLAIDLLLGVVGERPRRARAFDMGGAVVQRYDDEGHQLPVTDHLITDH